MFVGAVPILALNLNFLDPKTLQTVTPARVQEHAALQIIRRYSKLVTVEIDHDWFRYHKDFFRLKTKGGILHIKASTGVAAVWGFNYYLKKYCKSQIEWQTEHVNIPEILPYVKEKVVASDRFRYYQNTVTASYSFVWWNIQDWMKHIEWMALNGINLTVAPVAQEAIWARVYRKFGMTQEEIDKHFTGPAFLSWLRMGNVRGWGGPLPKSWHELQSRIQHVVIDALLNLGIVPILPAFNGHVPVAFSRLFSNDSFFEIGPWSDFSLDYCCGLFVKPIDPLFKEIGTKFLLEMGKIPGCHIYMADPFNEVDLPLFNIKFVANTARSIFETISMFDDQAVWLLQNWVFIGSSKKWIKSMVEAFLQEVPNGRLLILDMYAERNPKYDKYQMYFGQPFIWCMLHNFGGTLGMHGNMVTINKHVYEVRSRDISTMIGIGLTPEGINQNYVVYDLMLESGWRKTPVPDLEAWIADYAERRYGCKTTAGAWKYLLKSVYSYDGFGKVDGLYIVTRKPSFNYSPWAWYSGTDLIEAFRSLIHINNSRCDSEGYRYDVVDVTRQFLQYRIEQLYLKLVSDRNTTSFETTVQTFLRAFDDMALILATNVNFRASGWFAKARAAGNNSTEADLFEYNAWNQITLWGPNGELNDFANKQWSEMISHYYRPGWDKYLNVGFRNEHKDFAKRPIDDFNLGKKQKRPYGLARRLYYKWTSHPSIEDLPIVRRPIK
ncbi:hypothetical protein PYW07_006414 [Mythimna separata]|uniref:Alpha-N-acetylglucosaminidase n=1 Tax=Mythimna separata TaxID=271217 RepID=A0AAD8DWQ8_MYTSE|nr:hypothetical protein PYW07_006414 [Mythimna separata]